ncbi:putative mgs207 protein [Phaeomoniella chlamydospora]|uniref:Putative mgs207 protein n=1 Tax=Phaeomoniella chlamydospora TaxID=158046 RepID=A0A0G2GDE8_PHACM|nr:putative mgs207 protein [Phaeomoniella chlamydospora]
MFSSFALPIPRFRFGFGRSKAIEIPSVKIHDIEVESDKRARRFKHLVKLNHVNHALLGSAYLLEGSPEHLNDCYDGESKALVPWEDSPGEIAKHDWKDNLGNREYQRAYLDFFEDQLVNHGYDWQAVVDEFLLGGREPLVNWLVSDLGHPLIHLGYAYEVSSREICMEALTMASVCYSPMHKYIDNSSYRNQPTEYTTSSPLEAIARIAGDKRFDKLPSSPGGNNFSSLFSDPQLEQAALNHWNALDISTDPRSIFQQSQKLAAAILICSRIESGSSQSHYDFYLVHLLTTSHALRILIPLLPPAFHLTLFRQWWLITVGYYISQLRPIISYDEVLNYDLKDRGWDYVQKMGVEGKHSADAHYVKGLRALKVAAETWGDEDEEFFLKAAVRFAEEFDGWGGFTIEGELN